MFFNGVACHQNHIGRSFRAQSSVLQFIQTGGEESRDQFFRRRAHQGGIAERKAMIDRGHDLPITKQAEVLRISAAASTTCSGGAGGRSCDHAASRRLHLEFHRRLADVARPAGGRGVQDRQQSREDVDAADGDRGALSQYAHDQTERGHKIYAYLLRGLAITRQNEVWAMELLHSDGARLSIIAWR